MLETWLIRVRLAKVRVRVRVGGLLCGVLRGGAATDAAADTA